jgi:predicted DNA-binding WGR domain protein
MARISKMVGEYEYWVFYDGYGYTVRKGKIGSAGRQVAPDEGKRFKSKATAKKAFMKIIKELK